MNNSNNRSGVFLAAYRKSCSITEAAKAAELDRGMHYRWIRDDPEYAAKFAAACAEISKRRASDARKKATTPSDEIQRLRDRIKKQGEKIRGLEARMQALEGNTPKDQAATTTRTAGPPPEEMALLDQIARGMARQPFRKLNQEHQDAVRAIAERIKVSPD